MIPDLNFDSTDEGNYTAKELSDNSFLVGIFSNYGQINSYPNQVDIVG
jgi:hypothetical protein